MGLRESQVAETYPIDSALQKTSIREQACVAILGKGSLLWCGRTRIFPVETGFTLTPEEESSTGAYLQQRLLDTKNSTQAERKVSDRNQIIDQGMTELAKYLQDTPLLVLFDKRKEVERNIFQGIPAQSRKGKTLSVNESNELLGLKRAQRLARLYRSGRIDLDDLTKAVEVVSLQDKFKVDAMVGELWALKRNKEILRKEKVALRRSQRKQGVLELWNSYFAHQRELDQNLEQVSWQLTEAQRQRLFYEEMKAQMLRNWGSWDGVSVYDDQIAECKTRAEQLGEEFGVIGSQVPPEVLQRLASPVLKCNVLNQLLRREKIDKNLGGKLAQLALAKHAQIIKEAEEARKVEARESYQRILTAVRVPLVVSEREPKRASRWTIPALGAVLGSVMNNLAGIVDRKTLQNSFPAKGTLTFTPYRWEANL
ncbi:MAG: hypothetical protein UU73_C0003G0209 [Candidatus Daviesbacteria bacterium GW2011_GWA1_41_61]|uniref:Uncharacterized protein n=1 Tax=Candidatus Daviesbacteria bacterium GW2011_GWA2_40_9 TaxID=1618424 RepID=A0A0G0X850_9BACT|nr:MAG: hypothetical protein UU26_C0003G0017 [Candidatus Daviesbacteria bacterium GW2011_GWC1_40_9]KKR83832.1 MAG: hypothetical protein UU29_C0001G0052 [Candidatus Daviesbacteria bacterium GW2011_GWA2_40_9]KKR93441.1 MAG: hypothetical protein UU44_C0002G0102 [Candidatus Daviesbacteria bacterium GW2011_GWB1_41_15]KKS15010.1 MAG: hypothetical protein UU73_C0003G0209 [Candidatus Daviesbacteria bacterium GW2011_GWA1_41_61]